MGLFHKITGIASPEKIKINKYNNHPQKLIQEQNKNPKIVDKDKERNYHKHFFEEHISGIDKQLELKKIRSQNLASEKEILEFKRNLNSLKSKNE